MMKKILLLTLFIASCESPPEVMQHQFESANLNDSELELMTLINHERISRGLVELETEKEVQRLANEHLQNVIAANYPSHDGFGIRCDYLQSIGAIRVLENAAARFTNNENMFKAYMASPTHFRNIITPGLTHVGVASANGCNVTIFVQF